MDKDRDGRRFQALMRGMADNFRDTISAEGLRLRWEMLKPYTMDQVEAAGLAIMKKRKYTKMPPVAEFVEEIEGRPASLEVEAEKQWSDVVAQVRNVGSYGTPIFHDPTTRALFAGRFRFGDLCRADNHRLNFCRREFMAAYCAERTYPTTIGPGAGGGMQKQIENVFTAL